LGRRRASTTKSKRPKVRPAVPEPEDRSVGRRQTPTTQSQRPKVTPRQRPKVTPTPAPEPDDTVPEKQHAKPSKQRRIPFPTSAEDWGAEHRRLGPQNKPASPSDQPDSQDQASPPDQHGPEHERPVSSSSADDDAGQKGRVNIDRIMEEASEYRLNGTVVFERLCDALGTRDPDFVWGLTQQIISATKNFHFGEALGWVLSFIKDMKPQTHARRTLAVQMACVQVASMHFTDQLAPAPNGEIDIRKQDSAARILTSLHRTYAMQLNTLKNLLSGGEQRVTVRHVSVNEGGQAIVGNVDHSPRILDHNDPTTPALTDKRQPAIDVVSKRVRTRARSKKAKPSTSKKVNHDVKRS
jgi:hypothetical protein